MTTDRSYGIVPGTYAVPFGSEGPLIDAINWAYDSLIPPGSKWNPRSTTALPIKSPADAPYVGETLPQSSKKDPLWCLYNPVECFVKAHPFIVAGAVAVVGLMIYSTVTAPRRLARFQEKQMKRARKLAELAQGPEAHIMRALSTKSNPRRKRRSARRSKR